MAELPKIMAASHEPPRNVSTDYSEGYQFVRDITATESAIALNPGAYSTYVTAGTIYKPGKAAFVSLRLCGDGGGSGTAVIRVIEWPNDGPVTVSDDNQTAAKSKGRHLYDGTVTFAGSTTANVHPFEGDAYASTTFYEMSSSSDTFIASDRVVWIPSGSATSYEREMQIDVQGSGYIYVYATTLTTTSVVAVGIKKIQ